MKTITQHFSILSLLFSLCACSAVGPNYQAPSNALLDHFATTSGTQALAANWWQAWPDQHLQRLIERALQYSPDSALAQARLAQARAAQGMQDVATHANLGIGAKITSDKLSKNSENFANFPSKNIKTDFTNHQIGFDASWELDFFGRQQRLSEAAAARSESAQLRLADVRLMLSAEVARNYLELRNSQARLALATQNLALHDAALGIQEKALQLGETSAIEFEKARIARSNFAASLPPLQQSARQNIAALSSLCDLPVPQLVTELEEAVALLPLPEAPASGLPASLLQRRPDVRIAERELAAATADVGVAQADLYPRFSLMGTLGWVSVSSASLVEKASQQWSIGPQISLPLLNRSRLKDYVAVSEAQRASVQANYRKAVLGALADTEIALARVANSESARQEIARAVQQQQHLLQLSERQNKAGEISQWSVLETRKVYLQQQDAQLQSHTQSLLAMVALYKALGGGWQAP